MVHVGKCVHLWESPSPRWADARNGAFVGVHTLYTLYIASSPLHVPRIGTRALQRLYILYSIHPSTAPLWQRGPAFILGHTMYIGECLPISCQSRLAGRRAHWKNEVVSVTLCGVINAVLVVVGSCGKQLHHLFQRFFKAYP